MLLWMFWLAPKQMSILSKCLCHDGDHQQRGRRCMSTEKCVFPSLTSTLSAWQPCEGKCSCTTPRLILPLALSLLPFQTLVSILVVREAASIFEHQGVYTTTFPTEYEHVYVLACKRKLLTGFQSELFSTPASWCKLANRSPW